MSMRGRRTAFVVGSAAVVVFGLVAPPPAFASDGPTLLANTDSSISYVAPLGDGVVFASGYEVWRSDGTPGGTTVLNADVFPWGMKAVGSVVYMNAHPHTYGNSGLWKTDGTAAGTVPVLPVSKGGPNEPSSFQGLNGILYFNGSGKEGRELWRSDGTAAGTSLVKNIDPDIAPNAKPSTTCVPYSSLGLGSESCVSMPPPANSSDPQDLTVVNGRLFFSADDGVHGRELWVTDGTGAGTHLVKDINLVDDVVPAAVNSAAAALEGTGVTPYPPVIQPPAGPEHLTAVGNTLFFTTDDGIHGRELWRSDGTAAGTVLVKDIDIAPIVSQSAITSANGAPIVTQSSNPDGLTDVNGTLFFAADDGIHGREVWKSDGTATGTRLVADINPTGDGAPNLEVDNDPRAVNVNGQFLFSGTDGRGEGVWRTDGTAAGTTMVVRMRNDYHAVVNGVDLFAGYDPATGWELWRTDGTTAGTTLVQDIVPGTKSSVPSHFVDVNGRAFFVAWDGVHIENQLWAYTP
jgi:ELWxxDGT repeat protein